MYQFLGSRVPILEGSAAAGGAMATGDAATPSLSMASVGDAASAARPLVALPWAESSHPSPLVTRSKEVLDTRTHDHLHAGAPHLRLHSLEEARYLLHFFLHLAGELARVIVGLARRLR